MWNLFIAVLTLAMATAFTVLFWGVGIGVWYGAAFVGTLTLAFGSAIKHGFREDA